MLTNRTEGPREKFLCPNTYVFELARSGCYDGVKHTFHYNTLFCMLHHDILVRPQHDQGFFLSSAPSTSLLPAWPTPLIAPQSPVTILLPYITSHHRAAYHRLSSRMFTLVLSQSSVHDSRPKHILLPKHRPHRVPTILVLLVARRAGIGGHRDEFGTTEKGG
jgi:hypothetical protein